LSEPPEVAVPLVEAERLCKAYGETRVLHGVSLELLRGETTSLVGVSGSGKSTLISLLAGLLLPQSGRVAFDGQDLGRLDDAERARLRAGRIGVVLQRGNLIPFLTAGENVELALELGGGSGDAAALLAGLDVAHRRDHLPRRLSGGEAQRVALAVALANDPELLLADEVTGELDSAGAEHVMDVILAAGRERGLTVLFATHDGELAARAERRLRLEHGRLHFA
jgi:putative ABC transport system ATP-binding protein